MDESLTFAPEIATRTELESLAKSIASSRSCRREISWLL